MSITTHFNDINHLLASPTSCDVTIDDISFIDKLKGSPVVHSIISTELKLKLNYDLGYSVNVIMAYKGLQVNLKNRTKDDLIQAVKTSKFGACFVDFDADHSITVNNPDNEALIRAICKLDGAEPKGLERFNDKAVIRLKSSDARTEIEYWLMTVLNGDLNSSDVPVSKEIKNKFHQLAINYINACDSLD